MNISEVMKRKIPEEVEAAIIESAAHYYEDEDQTYGISDDLFDALVDILKAVKPDSKCLTQPGWGYDISKISRKKAKHMYQRVGSLEKCHDFSEIRDSIRRSNYIVTPKLDGLSAVAYFKNGILMRGITRGDGETGVDITDKMRILTEGSRLPNGFYAVRGELVISNKNWEILKDLHPEYKNQRNCVAGIINRNEIGDELKYIDFVLYNMMGSDQDLSKFSQFNVLLFLKQCFKKSVQNDCLEGVIVADGNEYLKSKHSEYSSEYPIDGVVITNNVLRQDKNGAIIYDQMAFKFASERATTKVIGIEWNLSRLNRLVPTVLIQPTDLSGATISRAAGFNAKFIKDFKIKEGSVIEIHRSGEVIPDITRVLVDGEWMTI